MTEKIDKDIENQLFEAGMSELTTWLEKKGWTVDLDYLNHDEMVPSSKVININTRQGIEKQLYSFLHECGHLLIQANWEKYETEYPKYLKWVIWSLGVTLTTPKNMDTLLKSIVNRWEPRENLCLHE